VVLVLPLLLLPLLLPLVLLPLVLLPLVLLPLLLPLLLHPSVKGEQRRRRNIGRAGVDESRPAAGVEISSTQAIDLQRG
jgi:hypothetical protein